MRASKEADGTLMISILRQATDIQVTHIFPVTAKLTRNIETKGISSQIICEYLECKTLYFSCFNFSGHYMYIDTSRPRVQGNLARLSTPALSFSGATCITFFYHMYGGTIGRLEVTVNGRIVFSASGNKGNSWLEASINWNLRGNYPVRNMSIVVKLAVAGGK